MRHSLAYLWILILAAPSLAQQPVDPHNLHERVLCVVPIVGSGTMEDPRRPMYAPLPPKAGEARSRADIHSFTWLESDDGRFALVEFVALDRIAFAAIYAEGRSDVKVFEKGKARRQDIEGEFRKHRKDFDLDRFVARMP